MPFPWVTLRPRIALVRLEGLIAARPSPGAGLNIATLGPVLDRAFALRRLAGVILVINSPGGSAAQSSLIAARIRALAAEKQVPVIACIEDAAASGGYWLACAADEIVADATSIVGSIGVISSGFGFQDVLPRLGVERRVHTAGTEKSLLDPFRPERAEDLARLEDLLGALHAEFRNWVTARRGAKLTAAPETLFTGRFWIGRQGLALGLVDRLGDAAGEAKRRFGEKVRVVTFGARRRGLLARLVPGLGAAAMAAVEERAAWARLGV